MRGLSTTTGRQPGERNPRLRPDRLPRRRRQPRQTAAVCGALLLLAVLLTGCSQEHYDERGKADAPVAGKAGEDSPAEVYNFPDGFGNLATKCVGKGKRGYATTRSVQQTDDDETVIIPANAVIVDDPECLGP